MVKSKNRLVAFMLLVLMTLTMLFSSFTIVHADADAYTTLVTTCKSGKVDTYKKGTKSVKTDVSKNRYKMSSGGTILYTALWSSDAATQGNDLFTQDFDSLTSGAKQDFLKDVFTVANAKVDRDDLYVKTGTVSMVTSETVTDMTNVMQQQTGMGGTLLASLLQNTKPDYVTANRIYEPFSGTVGTILGIIAILIMAALGLTMALDLAYITIPAVQMALGGSDEQGNGTKGKGIGGLISQEAKSAVKAADGGQGGQSGDGSYKAAVGIYFKYRWKGLVILGICLLYLVQGQIYSFVAWFIDLFSGFLGF